MLQELDGWIELVTVSFDSAFAKYTEMISYPSIIINSRISNWIEFRKIEFTDKVMVVLSGERSHLTRPRMLAFDY